MSLIRLLQSVDKKPLRRLVGGATVSSLSTTGMLAVITYATQKIDATKEEFVDLPVALFFVATVLLYLFFESRMIGQFAADIEEAVDLLRIKLVRRLRHADLWKLEHFGRSRLYGSITQSCKIISSNSQYLALAMRSVILMLAILIYIAAISLLAFVLLTILLTLASLFYYRLEIAIEKYQAKLASDETTLFERVEDLLDGFKEQRLSSAYSSTLGREYNDLSAHTVDARSELHRQSWQQFVFGVTMFHIMLGLIVFVIPAYSPEISAQLFRLSAAILFMMVPVFGLMQSLAVLRAAREAAGRMMQLEKELASLKEQGSGAPVEKVFEGFSEIRMSGIEYAYPSEHGEQPFTIGPLDVSVRRGEAIFITGGNGSGKSTFIKLLTGLYHPDRGTLSVDGLPVTSDLLAGYRSLIAPVFSDFHLFSQMFGLEKIDQLRADDLLQWMEMKKVTGLKGKRFTRINLSTGQRKRLALIAALLENKPILILDEWAADQDAVFRKKFYREILPKLMHQGLTIIAVTHDDRYFDAVERRFHLDEGRLNEVTSKKKGKP
ncbi:MAG: ATP-binding cassette domain-containing protein [Chlorobiaceae bacterium]|nr:ATP-binding cassette domain-containing protein [Chlorobiaceae bacterium]